MRDYKPHPYQRLIASHIIENPRCAVWAGMGMGKTLATLTALDNLFLAGEDAPVLVLAPLRVARDVWPNESKKWNHFRHIDVMPIIGSESERRFALRRDVSVYACNYDNLVWLVDHFGERWPFKTIVADESTKLKNLRLSFRTSKKGKEFLNGQGGKRARALGQVAHSHVKQFIELTGTPSPNGLKDLWGQAWFLDKGARLGRTYGAFTQRWFQASRDGYGSDPLPFAQEQIQDALRDLCITIDPKDWFDLKEPIVNNIYIDLPPKARKHYKEMEKEMFTHLEGHDIEAFGAAARTQKCLQIANGAAYVDPLVEGEQSRGPREWKLVHDEKLDALEDIVEEAAGMPVLVAYKFKSDLARILRRFKGSAEDISTTNGERRFKEGKVLVGCAHPASMGHGVDGLQEVTNIAAFFGHDWNLEHYQQIIERIGPMRQLQAGFERPMFIHHIIARDTVDEDVMLRRETKRSVQAILLDAMKRRR